LLITNFGVKKLIQNVHCRNANTCCRDDAAADNGWHNDVPVVHVTATLDVVKQHGKKHN